MHVENRKREHHRWVLYMWISLVSTKCQLKLTILILWNKFQLKLTILIFWLKFASKKILSAEDRKSELLDRILQIRISLGNKFQLKLTIFINWTKFAQKRYFWSKTEKVITTIEFGIFESVWVSNFSLNWPSKTDKVNTTIEFYIFELL